MLTIFLPVNLENGQTITINPAMIITIEPDMANPSADRCLLVLSGVFTTKGVGEAKDQVNSQVYWVAETRDSLLARISAAQDRAARDWWGLSKEYTGHKLDEGESGPVS